MSIFEAVTNGVFVATHLFCTTTTLIVGDDGNCLIVDPAVTVDEVDAMAAELVRRGLRIEAGFSTHPHWDHLLWRDSLGDAPRYATAVAAATAGKRVDHNVEHSAEPAPGYDAAVFTRVTSLEPGATTLPWPGRRTQVIEHRAHAPGHAGLFVPDIGVLIAGDMLSDIEIPLPDNDAAEPLADYADALETFATLEVRFVVPGHGTVGDTAELHRRLDLDRRYIAGVAAGSGDDDPRLISGDFDREHAATLARAGR